jgi:integrase/recombinase XerD
LPTGGLGLRRAELTNLKVKDFDPHYNPKNRIGLLIVHGKGRKQRALFVVDKLYDNLVNYLAHPQSPKRKQQPIFLSTTGYKITGDHILKIVRQAAQQAKIEQRITPHVLRH